MKKCFLTTPDSSVFDTALSQASGGGRCLRSESRFAQSTAHEFISSFSFKSCTSLSNGDRHNSSQLNLTLLPIKILIRSFFSFQIWSKWAPCGFLPSNSKR